ncbi:helix-turn-helix domain-containing protein [Clostridium botulinum]|nr:helix-turn-helix domain-containing protein [Clostridium botulinum]NFT07939.1 helix-turn-helix domain-containing protein [Clostridium botulinum]
MSKTLVYKVKEVAEMIKKPETTVTHLLRNREIKGTKSGTTWLIPKEEVDRYLGIETNEEGLKKDLEIVELKGKIRSLETQIQAFKSVASSLNNIIGL